MKRKHYIKIASTLFLSGFSVIAFCQVASITVDQDSILMQNPKLLLGITYDCRSSLSDQSGMLMGYQLTDGSINPAVDAVFSDFPMSTLRYPANGIMQGFEWKKSIGPIASRIPQQVFAQASIPAQVMEFGFDEFMAMTLAKGVSPKDVQIMVPIYDSAIVYPKSAQNAAAIPNVLQSNADWVEYANSPNDGSNPGGGTDWAAVRAANGHAAPYGIELWNMGNEPYTNGEYDANGVDQYIASIAPMIDAMLAIDPGIKITVTVQSNISSMWTTKILASPLLQGKIFGINCHFFLTEEVLSGFSSTGQPNVFNAQSRILALASAAQAQGLKLIVGDQAHAIISAATPTPAEQDIAMQWQGANETADMLLAMSQIENIDRSNFWVYGLWTNQWHPIRKNADGTFTSMPAAELYKIFSPAFLDNSLYAAQSSPIASDNIPYSVRSSAFASGDLSKINVLAVNRDRNDTIPFQINGMAGYDLVKASVFTATALNSDSILERPIVADASGNYQLEPMVILLAEYSVSTGAVHDEKSAKESFTLYPNPSDEKLYFSSVLDKVRILNNLGQQVFFSTEKANFISTQGLDNGVYFIQYNTQVKKFVVQH